MFILSKKKKKKDDKMKNFTSSLESTEKELLNRNSPSKKHRITAF